MDKIATLIPNRSDQEIVDDLRNRVVEAYKPLLDLCTEAQTRGFGLNVQIGPDAFGRFVIQSFQVIKVYK